MADVIRLSSSLYPSFSSSLSIFQPGLAPSQNLDKRIYPAANWDAARLAFRPRKRLPSVKVVFPHIYVVFGEILRTHLVELFEYSVLCCNWVFLEEYWMNLKMCFFSLSTSAAHNRV